MSLIAAIITAALATALCVAFALALRSRNARIDLLNAIIDNSGEAVLITNHKGVILKVNPAMCTITGYAKHELIGQKPSIMKSGRHDRTFYDEMWRSLREDGHWSGEVWDKRKNGELFPKMLCITAHRTGRLSNPIYIGSFSDLSNAKETNTEIDYLINHDKLTELPNATLLNTLLKSSVRKAQLGGIGLAVFTLRILRFKGVNEAFGFAGGEQVLKEAAKRLTDTAGEGAIVARTSAAEFTLAIETDINGRAEAADMARKLAAAMSKTFMVRSQYIFVGTSIGISMFPEHSDNHETLQIYSQKAMQSAELKGMNYFEFYEAGTRASVTDKLQIETNLRFALENNELVLHYQPQVDMRTGEIYGAEALVRRQEPHWLIQPGHFIGVAIETGLILDICEWTMLEGCRQHMSWLKKGIRPVRMAINASAVQFHQKKIVSKVEEILKITSIDPKYLEIEVTEQAFMHNSEDMIKELQKLRDLGLSLSIDDFGTGYSSLGYLRRFPIDSIKIDISFVREIGRSKAGETIVNTIINLAHNLGFRALAEGVETKEQLDFLIAHECDDLQGFYFSKPKPPEKFVEDIIADKKLL